VMPSRPYLLRRGCHPDEGHAGVLKPWRAVVFYRRDQEGHGLLSVPVNVKPLRGGPAYGRHPVGLDRKTRETALKGVAAVGPVREWRGGVFRRVGHDEAAVTVDALVAHAARGAEVRAASVVLPDAGGVLELDDRSAGSPPGRMPSLHLLPPFCARDIDSRLLDMPSDTPAKGTGS
jgi:hypothetical protein